MSAWENLAGKTVLVTGATGFLGGALARRLASEGANVKALARRPGRDRYIRDIERIDIIRGDITDADRMRDVVQGCEIVFHVAAALDGTLTHQYRVNVQGTRHMTEAAASAGVQRLVHVSSIAVYGYDVPPVVTEDTPQHPGNVPYNISKSEAEDVLKEIADTHALEYSIIRPGMIYGARSSGWTDTMFRLARLNPTPFVGSGSGTAYPVHVDDVVDMMGVLAVHPDAANDAFNCTFSEPVTWREFIGAYSQLAGHDNWLPLPVWLAEGLAFLLEWVLRWQNTPQDAPRLLNFICDRHIYSMEKARQRLNWQPQITLAEGIQKTIPYLREKGYLD